jgi:hypothetical protein
MGGMSEVVNNDAEGPSISLPPHLSPFPRLSNQPVKVCTGEGHLCVCVCGGGRGGYLEPQLLQFTFPLEERDLGILCVQPVDVTGQQRVWDECRGCVWGEREREGGREKMGGNRRCTLRNTLRMAQECERGEQEP